MINEELLNLVSAFQVSFIETLKEGIMRELHESLKAKQYPLVLDIDEAAEFSGISKTRLRDFANYEKDFPILPREKGEKLYFSRDGLTEWVRNHEGR